MTERQPARGATDGPWWDRRPALVVPPSTGVEVALLDRDGRIVAVNEAWEMFRDANGGDPARCGVGASYPEVCAAAGDDGAARQVLGAVRAALGGDLPAPLAVEIPCHSTDELRWFDVLVSSRLGDDGRCVGATVTLSASRAVPQQSARARPPRRLSERPLGTRREPAVAHEHLGDGVAQAVFAMVPCAVLLADDTGRVLTANAPAEELFGVDVGGLVGRALRDLVPDRRREDADPTPVGTAQSGTAQSGTDGHWSDPAYSGRTGVGARPDGALVRLHLTSAPVPLCWGTGTLVAATPVDHGRDTGTVDAGSQLGELDAAVRSIFAAGLTVAGVRERLDAEDGSSRALGDAMVELDRAARSLRRAGLRRPPTD